MANKRVQTRKLFEKWLLFPHAYHNFLFQTIYIPRNHWHLAFKFSRVFVVFYQLPQPAWFISAEIFSEFPLKMPACEWLLPWSAGCTKYYKLQCTTFKLKLSINFCRSRRVWISKFETLSGASSACGCTVAASFLSLRLINSSIC